MLVTTSNDDIEGGISIGKWRLRWLCRLISDEQLRIQLKPAISSSSVNFLRIFFSIPATFFSPQSCGAEQQIREMLRWCCETQRAGLTQRLQHHRLRCYDTVWWLKVPGREAKKRHKEVLNYLRKLHILEFELDLKWHPPVATHNFLFALAPPECTRGAEIRPFAMIKRATSRLRMTLKCNFENNKADRFSCCFSLFACVYSFKRPSESHKKDHGKQIILHSWLLQCRRRPKCNFRDARDGRARAIIKWKRRRRRKRAKTKGEIYKSINFLGSLLLSESV